MMPKDFEPEVVTRAAANPSFIVLNIPNSKDGDAISKLIAEELPVEIGSFLAPLGSGRFVLARPAMKALQRRHGGQLTAFLGRQPGVAAARKVSGTQIAALYSTRDPLDAVAPSPTPLALPHGDGGFSWHMRAIKVPEARSILDGAALDRLRATRIGHLDTGFTRHPAFGPWNHDSNENVLAHLGVNYLESGQVPRDPIETHYPGQPGHGTRIGSVIAAVDPKWIVGIAAGAKIVPYRITNSVLINFMGSNIPVGEALTHAIQDAGCSVINISLGDPCFPGRKNGRAVDMAYEAGAIVVAAAGNITSEVTYPGRHARVICAGGATVAKTEPLPALGDFQPWRGASRGNRVTVSGPADKIVRATWRVEGTTMAPIVAGGGDGTSFATAHISGLAALWLARWGDALDRKYADARWKRVEAFRTVLRRAAHKPPHWPEAQFGAGVVDAEAVLKAELPDGSSLQKQTDLAEDDIA
jgi:subtilisin family serine protease